MDNGQCILRTDWETGSAARAGICFDAKPAKGAFGEIYADCRSGADIPAHLAGNAMILQATRLKFSLHRPGRRALRVKDVLCAGFCAFAAESTFAAVEDNFRPPGVVRPQDGFGASFAAGVTACATCGNQGFVRPGWAKSLDLRLAGQFQECSAAGRKMRVG